MFAGSGLAFRIVTPRSPSMQVQSFSVSTEGRKNMSPLPIWISTPHSLTVDPSGRVSL